MNAPDEGELFVCGHGKTPDARHWCQDMRDAGIPWPGSAVADADLAELRARAEKAEAEAVRLERQAEALLDGLSELHALRDGIQALADEWEQRPEATLWDFPAALRGLLSPTPEGPPR